jgi:methyl-accepting chemotaxis protein
VAEITRGIEQAAGMANQTADGARSVASVAGELASEGDDLRRRVDGFLERVRVA